MSTLPLPDGKAIAGTSQPLENLNMLTPAPGLDAVWLSDRACLMQSHIPTPDNEGPVITVVGVADFSNWPGAVLMLD